MPAEADDGLPTTESGTSLRKSDVVTALRWVYPSQDLVTVLADEPVVLGRSPSATTQLETERVSRKHAVLDRVGSVHVVRDLDSKNGTFVNGDKIAESALRTGDVLRVGDCVAVVEAVGLDDLAGFRDLGQGILGGSATAAIVERVRQAAANGTDLFLLGETGTGTGLLARAYHRLAAREGALVVFDCAHGTESILESELFGRSARGPSAGEHLSVGHVRAADRGTLVLRGILELPVGLQAKVAETIERRAVTPVGEEAAISVDVRFIATSSVALDHQPLERHSTALRKHFDGLTVELPPLRERRSDVVPLLRALLERYGGRERVTIEPELVEQLCLHDWPMNVRELDSVARRLLERGKGGELRLEHLGEAFVLRASKPSRAVPTPPPSTRRPLIPYASEELAALRAALERHGGNLTKAAKERKITRSKAYRMLKLADGES